MSNKIIVFGTGSGRCGTASLAALLHQCKDSLVGHEIIPHLHWEVDDNNWGYFQRRLNWFNNHPTTLTGDVFSVYLPYLEKMEESNLDYNWYGIILKRNKKDTVESFVDITGTRNNWEKNKIHNPMYVKSFPKYETTIVGTDNYSKAEALGMYWEEYYDRAEKLADKSERIKIYPIDILNSREGQGSIFDFIGLSRELRVYQKDCKYNSRQDYKARRFNAITMP